MKHKYTVDVVLNLNTFEAENYAEAEAILNKFIDALGLATEKFEKKIGQEFRWDSCDWQYDVRQGTAQ
jgi:hypothetical protein